MQKPNTTAAIFSGTYERSLDAKNRLTIPASWPVSADCQYQVVPNGSAVERFLIVLTPEEFAATEQRIEATDQPPARKREAIRAFYAMAKPISVDKQGRVVLPEEYCRKAGLTGDVVLLGGKSRFEIWSKEQWTAKENANQATYEEFAGLIGL